MSIQDANAGNAGDLLKHAILLELLGGIPGGEIWSYAETHAGAGLYACVHAAELLAAADSAAEGETGWRYATALAAGMRRADAGDLYVGSALLALLSGSIRGDALLVEFDPEVVTRLREGVDHMLASAATRVRLAQGSFEDHLTEILAPQRLVLLADPYYYDSSAPDGQGGRMGKVHLQRIAGHLRGRDAVLLAFTSRAPRRPFRDAVPHPEETWRPLFADLDAQSPSALRLFRAAGTPHALAAAGWGAGEQRVAGLPTAREWQVAWLAKPPVGVRIVEEQRVATERTKS